MNEALQRYVEAATGLSTITRSKAEQIAKQLVKSGEAAQDQVGDLVEELLERQRKNREAMTALVKSETNRAVRAMGLATNKEVERLQRQVADLKREVTRLEGGGSSTRSTAKTASKKASSKKASSKKASAKKASSKKASSKKASAKKASSKKASAKKSTAKKSTAKKSTAKKATAKKATAKKATGQSSAAKKATGS